MYQSLKGREIVFFTAISDEKKANEDIVCLMTYEDLIKLQNDIRILTRKLSEFIHD